MYFDEEADATEGHTIYIRDEIPTAALGKIGDICLVRVSE